MGSAYRLRGEKPDWVERLQEPGVLVMLLFGHAALAVLMRVASPVSKFHAFATLLAGLAAAAFSRKPEYAAYFAGYITACEVLWRMTRGTLVWEHGKYAVLAIMIVALLRFRNFGQPLAALQFLLLVPSSFLPLAALSLADAKDALSFNLSGPLALCICVLYMAHLRWTAAQFHALLILMICPLFGIAGLTVYNMQAITKLTFNGASNYIVTGGFGPNQVSAALGLGAILTVILITSSQQKATSRLLLAGALLLMIGQCFMTFSRNGIYSSVLATFAGAPFLISDPKARIRVLIGVPLLVLVFVFGVFPILDGITDGKLSARFQNTDSSHRDEIAFRELDIWMENFVAGVGPGMGRYLREDLWDAAAHTEFSRLVAEHGLLGFGALLLYPVIFLIAFQDAGGRVHKGVVVCCVAWAVCFMMTNAMRMVAPSFVFGLACVKLDLSTRQQRRPEMEPDDIPVAELPVPVSFPRGRIPFPGVASRAN